MTVEIKVTKGRHINLTLEESDSEVTCGIDYAGKPEELVAMLGISERDIALFLLVSFIGGFVIGVVTVTELLKAFSQA